jgi:hypothetical protein
LLAFAGVGFAAVLLVVVVIVANQAPEPKPVSRRNTVSKPRAQSAPAPRVGSHQDSQVTPPTPAALAKNDSPEPMPIATLPEIRAANVPPETKSNAPTTPVVEVPTPLKRPEMISRVPAPPKTEQQAKRKELEALFELSKPKTAEQKAQLATLVWRTARESENDRLAQFVLFDLVRELAIEIGNILVALDAVEALERRFEYDGPAARAQTVVQLIKSTPPADMNLLLVTICAGTADRLSAEQCCEDAERIQNALGDALRRTKDQAALAPLAERRRANDAIVAVFKNTKWAFSKLEQAPDDPAANHAVGRFLLLANQEPTRALSCLAKSNDPKLQAAAELEVSQPPSPMEQLELADRWWELAEKESNKEMQRRFQARAGGWYERAKPQLMGLMASKAEQRLSELSAANVSSAEVGPEKSSTDRLKEGLLAHWRFDEGEGSVAGDSAGENQGVIKGATWIDGIQGKALHFDGKKDSVLIGNNPILDFDGEITLAAWVRVTTLPPIQTNNELHMGNIITHGFAWDQGREVRLTLEHTKDNGPVWDCAVWFGHGRGNSLRTFGPLSQHELGSWTHVAVTYDGSAWRMYRNAMLVAERASKVGAMKLPSNWAIGAHHTGSGRNFLGDIDDVRIYQRGLGEREIRALYESTSVSPPAASP